MLYSPELIFECRSRKKLEGTPIFSSNTAWQRTLQSLLQLLLSEREHSKRLQNIDKVEVMLVYKQHSLTTIICSI